MLKYLSIWRNIWTFCFFVRVCIQATRNVRGGKEGRRPKGEGKTESFARLPFKSSCRLGIAFLEKSAQVSLLNRRRKSIFVFVDKVTIKRPPATRGVVVLLPRCPQRNSAQANYASRSSLYNCVSLVPPVPFVK